MQLYFIKKKLVFWSTYKILQNFYLFNTMSDSKIRWINFNRSFINFLFCFTLPMFRMGVPSQEWNPKGFSKWGVFFSIFFFRTLVCCTSLNFLSINMNGGINIFIYQNAHFSKLLQFGNNTSRYFGQTSVQITVSKIFRVFGNSSVVWHNEQGEPTATYR